MARIPGARVIALSYVFAGLIAGIAAIMLTGRLASASSNLASPTLVLDVVSACVVGGISIYGGVGKVYGAVFGALFMTLAQQRAERRGGHRLRQPDDPRRDHRRLRRLRPFHRAGK